MQLGCPWWLTARLGKRARERTQAHRGANCISPLAAYQAAFREWSSRKPCVHPPCPDAPGGALLRTPAVVPAQLDLDAGLGLVLLNGQPLQIGNLINAIAHQGDLVVDLESRAGASWLPGGGAGVEALEFSPQSW